MSDFEYTGMKVVQQPDAPPFYMTSAAADELLEWCDVPRAKGDYMAGYQRTLNDKRIDDLAKYLNLSPNNIIPGAVIVAVDLEHLEVSESDGMYSLRIRGDTRDFDTKLAELWGAFTARLANEELDSAGIGYHVPDEPSSEDEDVSVDDESVANGGEAIGPSDIEEVLASEDDEDGSDSGEESEDSESDDDVYPSSYLASLAKELGDAIDDWDSIPTERQDAIRSYIEGVSKPGLIIDGQHRVFGAKNVSSHDVILPIILLPGLPFAEQVFQFYVLNSKAKPLKPTELRRIVSTSLTNQEIEELYKRFRAAGIYAEEARWTLELDTNPLSPFRGRIDFGYGKPGTIIPENVADQVVRAFMKMPRSRYKQLTDPLGEQWADSVERLKIFFWFWNAIKEEYKDVWEAAELQADAGIKDQIFTKVALLTLQQFLLNRFVTALPYRNPSDDPPLKTQSTVEGMVKSTLQNLPASFFAKEWKMKQIDTTAGRKILYLSMEVVWNNQGKIDGRTAPFRAN